jgi:hypothetical protein
MDNSINIYYTHFNDGGNFELISTLNFHNSIVTSITLDNSVELLQNKINVKFASQVNKIIFIIFFLYFLYLLLY